MEITESEVSPPASPRLDEQHVEDFNEDHLHHDEAQEEQQVPPAFLLVCAIA